MGKMKDIVLIVRDVSAIAADLMELQVRHATARARSAMTKMVLWMLVVVIAALLAIVGFGMILWAGWVQLALVTGPAVSAYILGALLLVLALTVLLTSRSVLKKR